MGHNSSSAGCFSSTLSIKAARNDNNSSLSYRNALRTSSTGSIAHALLPQAISSTQIRPVLNPVIHQNSRSLPHVNDEEKYKRLLDKIINAAKEADIPTNGAFNMAALAKEIDSIQDSGDDETLPDLSYTSAFGDRSVNQLKHDMKIGAAGELFVYELLSHLQYDTSRKALPNLCPDDWPSSIRDYVRVHPYCEARTPLVEKTSQREEADIIYHDTDGIFTQFLLDKLYLKPSNRWKDAKPKYYIEVKTTPGECQTKFYMSKSQYRRMHNIASSQSNPVDKVYLIFRVYRLNEKDKLLAYVYMLIQESWNFRNRATV